MFPFGSKLLQTFKEKMEEKEERNGPNTFMYLNWCVYTHN